MKTGAELDRLEIEVLRGAREQLAPTRAERGALRAVVLGSVGLVGVGTAGVGTAGIGTAGVDGAGSVGAEASIRRISGVQPKSGPRAAAPREDEAGTWRGAPGSVGTAETGPSAAKAGAGALTSGLGPRALLRAPFGVKALAGGTLGGLAVGFAAGYLAFGVLRVGLAPIESRGSLESPNQHVVPDRLGAAPLQTDVPGPSPGPSATPLALEDLRETSETAPLVRRQSQAKEEVSVAPPAPMSFYEELTYLRRAQAALRRGESALALGLMQSLDRLQAGGALLSERGMTKVLSLCLLERTDEAVEVARELERSSDAGLYRERLAQSCASAALVSEPSDSVGETAGDEAPLENAAPGSEDRERQAGH